jgi:copper transport protein
VQPLPVASPTSMKRLLLMLALAALAAPGAAMAHAILLGTAPANRATLRHSPRDVRVTFDDSVRLGRGNAAVANDTRDSVLSAAPAVHGHSVVLPLRRGLPDGTYSVRWSIVAEDGHRQQGVFAFAVGSGGGSATSVLGASVPLSFADVALRALYLAGALSAGGIFAFWLLVRRLYAAELRRQISRLLFFALLTAFIGAGGLEQTAIAGTRFALFARLAAIVAAAGAAAAALAVSRAKLLPVAGASAAALAAAPVLGGHALDPGSPAWLAVPVDLLHLGSAAVWIGGLVGLFFVSRGALGDDSSTLAAARRFSGVAVAAVVVLAASGIGRALTELDSVSQIWSTSYGRALIVKTALFLPLLAVGRLNRALLQRGGRLGRTLMIELAVLAAILAVIGVLTDLRPGSETPKPTAGYSSSSAPASVSSRRR